MSRDALIVGINAYSHVNSLTAPARDAEAIAQLLNEHGGFRVRRLPEVVKDDAPQVGKKTRVTLQQLEAALEQLFYPEGRSIPDTALFYFSGHGLRNAGRRIKEGFLATSDVNLESSHCGLRLKWLRELLEESPVRQQIVIIDCCHGGELLNFAEANPGDRGQGRDRCLIAASREFEIAYEEISGSYSTLTKAILQGLDPNRSGEGWLTTHWLVDFLNQQLQTATQQPTFDNFGSPINLIRCSGQAGIGSPPSESMSPETKCQASGLAADLRKWFDTLGYQFEDFAVWKETYFEWIIDIPIRRKRYDRILVRGIIGEATLSDVRILRQSADVQGTDEGWLVTTRRVSRAAREWVEADDNCDLSCFTLDELLDQDADFNGYLNWLETEIRDRGIDEGYIPLACKKEELDPVTQQPLGISRYGEADGWIDGYIDRWLDDPAKEHLSVLGEFGTGKTWFALHYAWTALKRYRDAQRRGVVRPRLPLVIPLRDYAKAVSVESLFSEFFFRKYEIPLPGYSAFEQLNRMGKLLLIFDGFDEMAARVNRQEMINNFWELAKVVVPGAKVILTCRTEHFPEAKEGRSLLNAELQASTKDLTGASPQFEVLELEKFDDEQIRQVLNQRARQETVEVVMDNPQLLDLARRPVMIDLVLEALPEIEAGKPADLARVYLYAVRRKMERDIKDARTFTSLADKLYFLCELSWEMLTSDRMSLNYQLFPERIRRLFGAVVQEDKSLDHWHYDMMGQTMLIRNADGDYSPAHRSLLEFFVTYKLVAQLGVLADDFTQMAREQSYLQEAAPQSYTWTGYFQRQASDDGDPLPIASLSQFETDDLEELHPILVDAPLAKAIVDLAVPMLDERVMRDGLLNLVRTTRGKTFAEAKYFGGNLIRLLTGRDRFALEKSDCSDAVIAGVDFSDISLRWANWSNCTMKEVLFNKLLGAVKSIIYSPDGTLLAIGDSAGRVQLWEAATGRVLWIRQEHSDSVNSIAFSPNGTYVVSGSEDKTLRLWDLEGNCIGDPFNGHEKAVKSVSFSPDGVYIASGSADKTIRLWESNGNPIDNLLLGHERSVLSVNFSPNGTHIVSGSADKTIRLWDLKGQSIGSLFRGHSEGVLSVSFNPDGTRIVSSSMDRTLRLWDLKGNSIGQPFQGHKGIVLSVDFNSDGTCIVSSGADGTLRLWDLEGNLIGKPFQGHDDFVYSASFSPDGNRIVSGGGDAAIWLWDLEGNPIREPLRGHKGAIRAVSFSPDGACVVSGSRDATLRLWDLKGNPVNLPFQGHEDAIRSVKFSPDGTSIASGSHDGTLRLWDLEGNSISEPFRGYNDGVLSVDFSPDGTCIVSGGVDKTLRLWNLKGNPIGVPFRGHEDFVYSVSFSPDGTRIVSGSWDTTIRLWDLEGNCTGGPFYGHKDAVRAVCFSPDGTLIVSGSADKTLRLWDLQGNSISEPFQGHKDIVYSVSFSLDGSFIISGSRDKTLQKWNLEGDPIGAAFQGHEDAVRSVSFSPGGNCVISGSWDKTLRLWDVATGRCIRIIDARLCAGLRIAGTVGLTEAQQMVPQTMGANFTPCADS